MNYIIDHWCGQHHIVRSLVNVLLVYIGMVAGVVIARPLIPGTGGQSGWMLTLALVAVFVYSALLLWSCVGVARSAMRTLRDHASGLASKIIAVCALLLLVAGLVALVNDLRWLTGA